MCVSTRYVYLCVCVRVLECLDWGMYVPRMYVCRYMQSCGCVLLSCNEDDGELPPGARCIGRNDSITSMESLGRRLVAASASAKRNMVACVLHVDRFWVSLAPVICTQRTAESKKASKFASSTAFTK
jgi:hypothetical protein